MLGQRGSLVQVRRGTVLQQPARCLLRWGWGRTLEPCREPCCTSDPRGRILLPFLVRSCPHPKHRSGRGTSPSCHLQEQTWLWQTAGMGQRHPGVRETSATGATAVKESSLVSEQSI